MFSGTPRKSSLFMSRTTPASRSGARGRISSFSSTGKRKREDSIFQVQKFEDNDIYSSDICGKLPNHVLKLTGVEGGKLGERSKYSSRAIQKSGWSAISGNHGQIMVWEQGVTTRGVQAAEPVSSVLQAEGAGPHFTSVGDGRRVLGRVGGRSVLAAATLGELSFWADHRDPGAVLSLHLPLQTGETVTCCEALAGVGYFVGSSDGKVWRVVNEGELMARQLRKPSGVFQSVGRMLGYSDIPLGSVRAIFLGALEDGGEDATLVVVVGSLGLEAFALRSGGTESFVGSGEFIFESLPTKAEVLDAALVQGSLVALIGYPEADLAGGGQQIVFALCIFEASFSMRNGVSLTFKSVVQLPEFSVIAEDDADLSTLFSCIEMELVANDDTSVLGGWHGPSPIHVIWAKHLTGTVVGAVALKTDHTFGDPVFWEVSGRGRCIGAGVAPHRHGCLLLMVSPRGEGGYLIASWSKKVHEGVEAGGSVGDGPETALPGADQDLAASFGCKEDAKNLSEALIKEFRTSKGTTGSNGPPLSRSQFQKQLAPIIHWLEGAQNAKVLLCEAVALAAEELMDARPAAGQLVHFTLQTKMVQHLAFVDWLQQAQLGVNSMALSRLAGLGEKLAASLALALLQANMAAKSQGGSLQQAIASCIAKERNYPPEKIANFDLTAAEIFYGKPSQIDQVLPHLSNTAEELGSTETLRVEALLEVARASSELLTGGLEHRRQESKFYNCLQPACPWTSTELVRDCIISQMTEYVSALQKDPFPSQLATTLAPCLDSLARVLLQGFEDEAMAKEKSKDGSAMETNWKKYYQKGKDSVLPALRLAGRQELAFSMAKQYLHFESLMELCDEMNDKANGEQEELLKLLRTFSDVKGTLDEPFPVYCLKWFEARDRPYDLLKVGSKMPEFLGAFLQTRPHLLWIHCLETKQYGPASVTLLSQAQGEDDLEMKKLSASLGKLCAMASTNKMFPETIGDELEEERILAESLDKLYDLVGSHSKPILGIRDTLKKCVEFISDPAMERSNLPSVKQAALLGCNVIRVSHQRIENKNVESDCLPVEGNESIGSYAAKILGNIAHIDKDQFEAASTSEWDLEKNLQMTCTFQLLYEQYSKYPEFASKVFDEDHTLNDSAEIAGSLTVMKPMIERCLQLVKDIKKP